MTLGGLVKRLFGGGSSAPAGPDRSAAVDYKGFRIIPNPRLHGGKFLTSALIEKDDPGGTRVHELIRADTHGSAEDAKTFSIHKAKQVIDEQGERIFG